MPMGWDVPTLRCIGLIDLCHMDGSGLVQLRCCCTMGRIRLRRADTADRAVRVWLQAHAACKYELREDTISV